MSATFPVGYARRSRYKPHRVKHCLTATDQGWQAVCGRAGDCIYEWQGFPAAVDCPQCAVLVLHALHGRGDYA